MPTELVPFVGVHNQRSINAKKTIDDGKDQRYVNVVFSVVGNSVTRQNKVYVEKRPGWGISSLVSDGNISTGFLRTDSIGSVVSAFGDTNSTIYDGTISVGTITGRALHFLETIISGIGVILIRSSDGTGWYYAAGSGDTTAYTADGNNSTTITDIKVGGVNSTEGLYSGQLLAAGTNIVAGTRIVSVNSVAFTAVLDTATTGGAFGDLAITKTPIAKIIDADFVTSGTNISAFQEIDGYIVYASEDGYLYNSDLNSHTSYPASGKLPINMHADKPYAVAKHKNVILTFGDGSMEAQYNAGNASGSPLSRATQYFSKIGVQNQRSITALGDDIYFVTSSRYGDVRVMRMRELSPQPVSTPTVEKILGTISASGQDIYLSGFQLGGYSYVSAFCTTTTDINSMLLMESGENLLLESGDDLLLESDTTSPSSFGRHLLYNPQIDIWFEWDSTLCTYIAGMGQSSINQIMAASRINNSGKLYLIKPASDGELYRDDGETYTMRIRTARMYHGTNHRKTVSEIRLITDMVTTGTATLSRCDDDSGTYVTIGSFDLSVPNPKLKRCGTYTGGRSYEVSHSDNGPFRAEALEIDYEVSAN